MLLKTTLHICSSKMLVGVLLMSGISVTGQDEATEEVEDVLLVTAQRVNEDIQDVPIAVTALSSEMIEDQQVITPSDLQMNAPSVSYSATNFGGSSFSIRGIGRLVIGSSGESGVSAHINEIPVTSNLNSIEFFDMERVELLRGPQGTLFGRNATGGAINFVTAKPEYNKTHATIDFEAGSFDHERFKVVANLGLTDDFAVRIAGYQLKREGYTENLAGALRNPDGTRALNVDESLDGRDVMAIRMTAAYTFNDDAKVWVLMSLFDEDDDRARITNQVCKRTQLPVNGCEPNEFALEEPNISATTAGIFAGAVGAFPLGLSGHSTALFEYPRPRLSSLRQTYTDVEPIYRETEKLIAFGFDYDLSDYSFGVLGAYRENEYLSIQDYIVDVGARLGPTPQNPSGVWLTSRPAGHAGDDWRSGGCNINTGTAGAIGGCILDTAPTDRIYSYDQGDQKGDNWVIEAKVRSQYDGPFNFVAGASTSESMTYGDYYVIANTLDLVSFFGAPAIGLPPLYPGFFNNASSPEEGTQRTAHAVFGETYYDMSDRTKLTVGLRYNIDENGRSDTSVLYNSINQVGVLVGSVYPGIQAIVAAQLGVPPSAIPLASAIAAGVQFGLLDPNHQSNLNLAGGIFWSRMTNFLLGPLATSAPEAALAKLYGVTDAQWEAAMLTPAYSAARIAISNMVPLVPQFGESRALTNSPTTAEFKEISGRFAIDHQLNDRQLIYGVLSKGYKPGGLNSAIPVDFQDTSSFTFGPEDILSIEVGSKNRLFDSRLTLNAAAYVYDYGGLQTTRIKNNSAIADNIDANVFGIEIEGQYRPEFMDALSIDFAYSYLNTTIVESESIDPINRTGGQDDWVLLKNIDAGALTALTYIARESQITAELVEAALAARRAFDIRNGLAAVSVSYPENEAGVSIPALFSQGFLAAQGVDVREGNEVDLDGNTLPNAPEHSMKLGLAYTQPFGFLDGTITYRVDYFRQSDSYAREFNTVGDQIDGWGQVNLSVIYESGTGDLGVKFWVRNLTDSTNVTGHYLTSDTSGFFRNYFLTEPKIVGATIRYSFGK